MSLSQLPLDVLVSIAEKVATDTERGFQDVLNLRLVSLDFDDAVALALTSLSGRGINVPFRDITISLDRSSLNNVLTVSMNRQMRKVVQTICIRLKPLDLIHIGQRVWSKQFAFDRLDSLMTFSLTIPALYQEWARPLVKIGDAYKLYPFAKISPMDEDDGESRFHIYKANLDMQLSILNEIKNRRSSLNRSLVRALSNLPNLTKISTYEGKSQRQCLPSTDMERYEGFLASKVTQINKDEDKRHSWISALLGALNRNTSTISSLSIAGVRTSLFRTDDQFWVPERASLLGSISDQITREEVMPPAPVLPILAVVDFSTLKIRVRSLELFLEQTTDFTASWDAFLRSFPGLTTLFIGFIDTKCDRNPPKACKTLNLRNVHFPSLKTLRLINFRIKQPDFDLLIWKHSTSLEELELDPIPPFVGNHWMRTLDVVRHTLTLRRARIIIHPKQQLHLDSAMESFLTKYKTDSKYHASSALCGCKSDVPALDVGEYVLK